MPGGARSNTPTTPTTQEERGSAQAELRRTLGAYATGVVLIAADVDGEVVGMLANSFTSISLDPPLVAMSFAHTSTTWPVLARARRLGISILGAEDRDRAEQLRRPGTERFEGVETQATGDGGVLLTRAAAGLVVERETEVRAGDHVVVLFRVLEHWRSDDSQPLVFHGGTFHHLVG